MPLSGLMAFLLALLLLSGSDTGLTLDHIVASALKNDPELVVARSFRGAAAYDAAAARTEILPNVSATANLTHNGKLPERSIGGRTVVFGARDEFDLTGRVDQIIFSGGRVTSEIRIAEITYLAERLRFRGKENEIIAKARTAFFEILRAGALARASRASLLSARAHRSDAEARVRAGVSAGVEIVRAEVRVKEAELLDASRRNALAMAKSKLARLIGLPTNAPIEIAGDFPDTDFQKSLADPETTALRSRPDLVALRAEAWAARERTHLARSEYFPQVGAYGSVTHYDANASEPDQTWKIGLSGSWEIFNWGGTSKRVRAANFRSKASAALVCDFEDDVRIQVRESELELIRARESLELAEARVRAAEEDIRISRLRFSEGLAAGTEVIDAESAHAESVAALINAKADFAIARNQWWFATGGDDIR